MRAGPVLVMFAWLLTSVGPGARAGAPPATAPVRVTPLRFSKPRYLGHGLFRSPRLPLVADVDGDGFADLIAVDTSAPGLVEVATSVRGGKFRAPKIVAQDLGGGLADAWTRPGAGRCADIVVVRVDGTRRVIACGADGSFEARDETAIEAKEPSRSLTAYPRVEGDFDGDGALDLVKNGQLILKADPEHPIALPFPSGGDDDAVFTAGDVSGDGRADFVVVRRDAKAGPVGQDILTYLAGREGEADEDGDGLDFATEATLGTDPLDADTDHDGLLDGDEVRGAGALDLPALGASPTHADVFVYVQRAGALDGALCRRELERAALDWDSLPNSNADGKTGIRLHPLWLPPIPKALAGKPWWDHGNANLPPLARGLAHYMVIGEGGGGQSSEMGDMGGCGGSGLYATFLHEFGHQVGLTHAGGQLPALCPTYTSLMSYAYSYGFDGDANRIHYSRGEFAATVLDETRLLERLPYPIDRIGFLGNQPYRFHLEADGPSTKIDWNRDGRFAREPVRADITDVYGANGGERFPVGKTVFAPVLVEHGADVLLFATRRDGKLVWRRGTGVGTWTEETVLSSVTPSGDPALCSRGGLLWLFVPTVDGVAVLRARDPGQLEASKPELLPDTKGSSVSAVTLADRVLLLLWDGPHAPIRFMDARSSSSPSPLDTLGDLTSTFAPGAVEDPVTAELLVGVGATRTKDGVERSAWRVHRLRAAAGRFTEVSVQTVGGEASGWCGNSRPVLLVEHGPSALVDRRLHFIARGMGAAPDDHVCFYEAITIGDATEDDGFRLRRFYDEWTTTKSPVGACFHDGDLLLAFRWFGNVHGDEDDNLLVSHHGFGIDATVLRDFDDVSEIANIGLAHSIPWLHASAK